MIPTAAEMEVPLLRVLNAKGGKARPTEVYEELNRVLNLTDADLLETVPSGDNKFQNRTRWTRQILIEKGDVYRADYGVWGITEEGKSRVKEANILSANSTKLAQSNTPLRNGSETSIQSVIVSSSINLEELAENYAAAFERKVLQELLDREPKEFEEFAAKLLTAYGFKRMKVTREHTSPDGGIDGNGELKVGLVNMRAAFQCKRWQGSIGRPEIDKFRGAIQGQYEHGYFFTTSTFSNEARKASIKDGAVPIFLFDGHEIVQIMIEKGLGIGHRPIEIYEDRIDSLFENE